jgi:hypothetical protein
MVITGARTSFWRIYVHADQIFRARALLLTHNGHAHKEEVHSPELARLFLENVIYKHGVPDNIVTDRGGQFRSQFRRKI